MNVIVWSDDADGGALDSEARQRHPHGIAATLADAIGEQLGSAGVVTTAGLHQPEDGLPAGALDAVDALVWWGHHAHDRVSGETVDRVEASVLAGLGLVVLHSGHHSKVFRRLMGTTCDLAWREGSDEERIWTVAPAHRVAEGVDQPIELGRHETYSEPFDVPAPDELVFVSTFTGGEVFRSGCCWTREAGRIFYFSPGHETDPVYEHPQIRRVIANALSWVRRDPARREVEPAAGAAEVEDAISRSADNGTRARVSYRE